MMAINISYMKQTRTELRIATDAASRAGGRMLSLSGEKDQVRLFARDAASRNRVAGEPLELAAADFEFGRSNRSGINARYEFIPDNTLHNPNALRLTGRRTNGSQSGAISLFAPNVLGIGSFETSHSAVSTQIELDICMVIDRSGSMAYADDEESGVIFPPPNAPAGWDFGDPIPADSRWNDAIAAATAFLDEMAATPLEEYVALVTYSDNSNIDVNLTSNYSNIVNGLTTHSSSFAGGSTNIGGGIIKGINSFSNGFERPWATKVIILLTDGIHYTGTRPSSAAYAVRRQDVIIYAVTFSNEADEASMQQVATRTGGFHVHANDRSGLVRAFRDIANQLPTLLTQ